MTQEKLYDLLLQKSRYSSEEYMHFVKKYLDEFFEKNVCITKGEHRHPYADILHEWIEGADNIESYYNSTSGWVKADTAIRVCHLKYRIKPSEPVYEWQWYYVKDGLATLPSNFYTDKEVDTFTFVKIEETKRERKQ